MSRKSPISRRADSHVPLASCGPELSSFRARPNPARAATRAAMIRRIQELRCVMRELSHRGRPHSVRDLVARSARRLRRARVFFGHGTDNAWDEAATLVLHALGLAPGGGASVLRRRVGDEGRGRAEELIRRRIEERIPAAYLTGETWFAGLGL